MPCIETPAHIEILDTYIQERDTYYRLARESAQKVGKDDYELFRAINRMIVNTVDQNLKINESGKIEQLVTDHLNPICVITGKKLDETFDDLIE